MAGWHATARMRQCDRACESVSRTGAGPRHRFCEWNTNPATPSLQNHHIRHLTPALPRAICVSLFPPLCSRAHDISPRERIASPAARFRRMSHVGSIVRRVEGNSRRYGAAYSAASRMAASLGAYGSLRSLAWNRPSVPAEDLVGPNDEPQNDSRPFIPTLVENRKLLTTPSPLFGGGKRSPASAAHDHELNDIGSNHRGGVRRGRSRSGGLDPRPRQP